MKVVRPLVRASESKVEWLALAKEAMGFVARGK